MKRKLVFEIVDMLHLKTGNTMITCQPNKFNEPLLNQDNYSTIKIGNQESKPIKIIGEEIIVRRDTTQEVGYAHFQTSDDVKYLKNHLGKDKITLIITY